MTPHMYSPDPSDALTQARSTVDYLIQDVVRLKERIGELESENDKLKRRLDDVVRIGPQPNTFRNSKPKQLTERNLT